MDFCSRNLRDPSQRRLKVLFVINTPLVGGAERHTFDLSRRLNGMGFESHVFAMKRGAIDHYEGGELLSPRSGTGLSQRIGELRRELESQDYDLVVGVNERPIVAAFFARRAATGVKPAIVGILHSTILRNWRERLLQIMHFQLFSRIDGVIFISENQRRYWQSQGMKPTRQTTILNGVDIAHYSLAQRDLLRQETRDRFGFAPETFVVGLSAVLRPEKNHLQLVEVLARLRADGGDVNALFVGDGPMRAAIEARIAALGLGEAIQITGMVKDVRPYLAAMDVGVNCSVSIETVSLSALETLAMGVPIVMSEIGGASEIVNGENGRLFAAGDDDGMLAALRHFQSGETRAAAGRAARQRVEALFDQDAMAAAYADCFRTFAGERTSASLSADRVR